MYYKSGGVLLHITSLNGDFGCGTLGEEAYNWIDFISECGFVYWQILPISIPDRFSSPYSSLSSVLGNPILIDPRELCRDGLINTDELNDLKCDNVFSDIEKNVAKRLDILKKAAARADENLVRKVNEYAESDTEIMDCSRFFALRHPEKNASLTGGADEEFFYRFLHYTFDKQWRRILDYAHKKGVKIIGDIPIYVDTCSYDVYKNPECFRLNADKKPDFVSGFPGESPNDYGQKWNHPLYNNDYLKRTHYSFLLDRFKRGLKMFDVIRIDHFRAFSSYYSIPADEPPAKGHWEEGLGAEFVFASKRDMLQFARASRLVLKEVEVRS